MIGNSKVFSDTIKNYSSNRFRRVDLTAQLDHGADVPAAVELLKAAMAKSDRVNVSEGATCQEIGAQ